MVCKLRRASVLLSIGSIQFVKRMCCTLVKSTNKYTLKSMLIILSILDCEWCECSCFVGWLDQQCALSSPPHPTTQVAVCLCISHWSVRLFERIWQTRVMCCVGITKDWRWKWNLWKQDASIYSAIVYCCHSQTSCSHFLQQCPRKQRIASVNSCLAPCTL